MSISNSYKTKTINFHVLSLGVFIVLNAYGSAPYILILFVLYLLFNEFKIIVNRKIILLGYTLVILVLLGLAIHFKNLPNDILRDLLIFLNPIIIYLFTINLLKHLSIDEILDSVFIITKYISYFSLFIVLFYFLFGLVDFNSLYSYRSSLPELPYEIFVYLLLFLNSPKHRKYNVSALVFLGLILLYFSRNFIVIVLLYYFFYYKSRLSFIQWFGAFLILLITTLALFSFKSSYFVDVFLGKAVNSFSELFSDQFSSNSMIINNWRAYEMFSGLNQFQNSEIMQMIFGRGLGTRIDLNGEFWLAGEKYSSIPFLHNGYITILLKGGVICLLIVLIFLFKSYHNSIDYLCKYNLSSINKLSILVLAFTTFIVMGIFSISSKIGTMFFLIFLLNNSSNKTKVKCQ